MLARCCRIYLPCAAATSAQARVGGIPFVDEPASSQSVARSGDALDKHYQRAVGALIVLLIVRGQSIGNHLSGGARGLCHFGYEPRG
eukprot:1120081-Pyramimonas_sp.AAC.1